MIYPSVKVSEGKLKDIREGLTNSKEFVNIFIENTINKSDNERTQLFNTVISNVAKLIELG